jgi:hypothetical protein
MTVCGWPSLMAVPQLSDKTDGDGHIHAGYGPNRMEIGKKESDTLFFLFLYKNLVYKNMSLKIAKKLRTS